MEQPTTFVPGLTLCESFYREAAAPILQAHYPDLRYAAALVGTGSEVLGYDDPRSTDHHWGPRFLLFLSEQDSARAEAISRTLANHLPHEFRGYAAGFGPPDEYGTRLPDPDATGPVDHMIRITTVRSFLKRYLGCDPFDEMTAADWLVLSEQKLLTVTAGRVFRDDLAELTAARGKLSYYPREVWLYLLACEWRKIAQEEHLMGRAGSVEDEVGSALIAARLVHSLMRLCFLMAKRYAPYPKWFGTAFKELPAAQELAPILTRVLSAGSWREREGHLSRAYEFVAAAYNALGITPPLPGRVSQFYSRPFFVIQGDRFVHAILDSMEDRELASLPPIGSVEQFSDSTDLISNSELCNRLRNLYE